LPTNLASPSVAEAARRPASSSRVGRLASSDSIQAGGFTPGAVLAERYRVIGLLGRGGMGEVYRADDLKLGQPVALKFLPRHLAADRERLERFFAEVRIARQVSHPNVCRVYDVGEIDGQQYLSMEYVDGEDLASLLKRIGRLPPDKALEIARELCAGLAAAHERGVLHRDLKPANVMIDGRGRARITDFGLAVAAGEVVEGEVSGTPAYMAPEQLAGKGASVRSDVYALGLLLYELYTGRKAFDGATFQELKRKHSEDPPASPSTISPGFDPVVERVILRCLEKEPSARPASASQVAAALPGGDPLAAALAAGETPSPEMLAAAGVQGALAPARAWALLAAILIGVVGILAISRYSMDQGVMPFPKSPDALEDRARELVAALGWDQPPADRATWWSRQYDYLLYRAATIPSTRNFRELATARPHPWWFFYRQSPRKLQPLNPDLLVRANDPPFEVSGMVTLGLDARGQLIRFRAAPPQVETPPPPAAAPDWKRLFAAAGLDPARFTPSVPRWLPSEPFDARESWDGSYAESPEVPIHVDAASWRGRPVSFEILGPWSRPERMQPAGRAAGSRVREGAILFIILSVMAAGGWLARRHLRMGSGDRRGALRVSLFCGGVTMLAWVFLAHHVSNPVAEAQIFFQGVANALFEAAMVWVTYVAIEPIVRRRWPDLLFSWSRVLTGRFRDPLVGRDALAGILGGLASVLVLNVSNSLANWIELPGMTPAPPSTRYLLGVPATLGHFFETFKDGTVRGLAIMTVLVVAVIVLRRRWLAAVFATLLLMALALSGENYAVELPAGLLIAAIGITVAARFGILALCFSYFTNLLLIEAPLTLDFSRWHAGRGLFLAGVVVALAVWAFRVSLGGKPVFAGTRLDEA
jgi:serine/threonine-protein kinase